jgi:nitrogen fixation NifU-like protein
MYSETVMEHFKNPRNVGTLEDADGVGEVGNPVCGDMMTFYIKVKDNRIEDIKFQTFGCGAAIAVSSMVSEMAKGKTLEEASKITNKMVAEALEGLPKQKLHCSNLGADALRKAIQDYRIKKAGLLPQPDVKKCYCPVCDLENPMEAGFCTGCGKELSSEDA